MNIDKIRKDFTILEGLASPASQKKPFVYMDSACMSLRPKQVVDEIATYYNEYPACGGRSKHRLASIVEDKVNDSRKILQKFISAKKSEEIIFTKNTTEGLNLVYKSLEFKRGDVILSTDKEHNSNLIPAQQLVKEKGIIHKIVPSKPITQGSIVDGVFDIDAFSAEIDKSVKLVSVVHTSNLDGTSIGAIDLKELIKVSHDNGSLVMLDCAQSAPHKEVDVKSLGVDFISFSGHKMMGPSGTGVLYGKYLLLDEMKPFVVGGETVLESWYDKANFEAPPHKYEAGLKNYSGILGLGAATKYLLSLGQSNIAKHEQALNKKLSDELLTDARITLIGPREFALRSGIFNFQIKGVPHDRVASVLDNAYGIMTRSGYHCVHSWYNARKLAGSTRASFYAYNTLEEMDYLANSIRKVADTFSR